MNPAYSVIVFTTASGAGYGLLFWLAVYALGGGALDGVLGFAGFGLALALITAGLMSSTLHLGRPERAWRAFSQWRTSWLSREGVAAVATYVPSVVLAGVWVLGEGGPLLLRSSAALALTGAVATVWCTGMIYASLPTVRLWHQPLTAPIYLALAGLTGAVLFNLLLLATGSWQMWTSWVILAAAVVAWTAKAAYWDLVDTLPRTVTIEDATGLGRFGAVRPLIPPHTQANFVMREMGYRVARKHRTKLRRIAALLLFVVPILAALIQAAGAGTIASAFAATVSLLCAELGVVVERWLFFAEAEHVSMVYYDAKAA